MLRSSSGRRAISRQQGVDVDVLPVRGRKNPMNYLRAWLAVQSRLFRGSYDLIHAQWAQAALAALPARLPLVVTFRGSDVEGIVSERWDLGGTPPAACSKNIPGLARVASEAILVAARMARLLPHRDYHVIPSGLDLELFRPIPQSQAQTRLGIDRGGAISCSPRLPNPVKRFKLARAAVECLDPSYRAGMLVATNMEPCLMPLYINACDVLLVTSAHEGSPNVVKEALACNLPVVSVDVGDVRERIQRRGGLSAFQQRRPANSRGSFVHGA